MKKITTLTILSLLTLIANAQTDVDALRYSGESITGTARYTAMAGAFGAIGGDFTTLSHNPAGIGIYRSSEFTFSPSIYINNTSSKFINSSVESEKSNFNIGNCGLIFTKTVSNNPTSEGWKSWNFGLGYNRIENFHARGGYQGLNPGSSMMDNFAENATGLSYSELDAFYEYPAYICYLINPDSSNHYTSAVSAGNVNQYKYDQTLGAMGETVFSFGGNYSNKLFLGATMGLKFIRYVYTSVYNETAINPADSLSSLELGDNVTTHGSGIDFKFGMIYKPNDLFRFGIAIHTPTWYTMHDDFTTYMSSRFDNGFKEHKDSPFGEFDYDLSTPFSALGSVAVIFGKSGMLSADYQYSDYGDAYFSSYGTSFNSVNNLIQNKYTGVHTVRLGGEIIADNVSFRAGYSMSTSPLEVVYRAGNSDFSKESFSGGVGFKPGGGVFIDFAYVYTLSNQFYQPYTLENIDVPGVKNRVATSNIVITAGVKF